jgi:UDP-N-acetylglucosamine 2-epimerase (non-hydrolysing)
MTIVGTRPEVIKLSRVITELDKHTEHVLMHSGQNWDYELNEIFFEQMGLRKPDTTWPTLGEKKFSAVEATARMMTKVEHELEHFKPDAVLILGDTNSCVAAAYATKRRHTPVFHMEAGNRCFDERVPEEVNRRIVDHISDINMPYTEHARRNLLAEGIAPDRIVKTGSPMLEVLHHYWPGISGSTILRDLELQDGGYFVFSAHREENVDDFGRLTELARTINRLAAEYRWPIIWPIHPRTAARIKPFLPLEEEVHVCKPLGFFDYAKLQSQAACVISDSGTLTEEAAMMGFPAVTIRQAHERPEGSDEGTLIRSDIEPGKVLAAIKVAMAQSEKPRLPPDYEGRQVAQKVVRTILGYTDIVCRQY